VALLLLGGNMQKEVTLTLKDYTFTLRLDMTAISDIEDLTGVDLLNGGTSAQEDLKKPRVLTGALYALAGASETGMTQREFGRLLDIESMQLAMQKMGEVFSRDASPAEEGAEGKAKRKSNA
jgi:hypothetical protein